jgi:hypothetical protein
LGITGVGRVVCFTGKGVEEASIKSLRKIGELAAPIVAINASDPGEETTTIIRYAETPNKHEHMQIAGLSNSSRPPIDETY